MHSLLLIRHAPAADRDEFALTGEPDAQRPLTDKGRDKMARAAAGLARAVPELRLILSSPYRRALETAAILAAAYGELSVSEMRALAPGAHPRDLEQEFGAALQEKAVALVGHEPDLSMLAAWLLTGRKAPFMHFKKGAACRIDFPEGLSPGAGQLVWHLSPALLRRLGGRP